MTDRAVPRELRERLSKARSLCLALGLEVAPRASQVRAMICCPAHAEKTPSCNVRRAADGTLAAKCHACGWSGDALGLIAKVRGLDDFAEVLRVAAELANAPALVEPRETRRAAPAAAPELSEETYHAIWMHVDDACRPLRAVSPSVAGYLTFRRIFADAEAAGVFGLPRDGAALVSSLLATFQRADLERAGVLRKGCDAVDFPAWPVCIPWRDRYGRITCVQRRRLDDGRPKYRFPAERSPRAPFGVEHLRDALQYQGADAEIIITEGALDALARRRIARAKDELAVVLGVSSASTPEVGLPLDLFQGRRVVLALDNDAAGEAACAKLATALRGVASKFLRERPPAGSKDWLEALSGARGAS